MTNALRIALVLAAAAALAGSASSSSSPKKSGYYPRPQQPQPGTGYAPPYQNQPQTAQSFSPCETACGQIARCNVMRYDACLNECVSTGAATKPGGADQLNMIARTSCEQIQGASKTGGGAGWQQPAVAGGQWYCSASGSWDKCEPNGSGCRQQTTNGAGVGASEQQARGAALKQCSTYMTNLMTASFAFKTSIAMACRTTSCSPR
jgi:hypothetical protein